MYHPSMVLLPSASDHLNVALLSSVHACRPAQFLLCPPTVNPVPPISMHCATSAVQVKYWRS